MPTSKVDTVVFNREWIAPAGHKVFYFDITFEDGTEGQFSTNKQDQNKFIVGTETEYTIEVKQGGKGDWNKIDKPKQDQQGSTPAPKAKGWKKDPQTQREILAQSCTNAAFETVVNPNMIIADKEGNPKPLIEMVTGLDDIKNLARKYYNFITKSGSSNDQLLIILQSQLKNANKSIDIPAIETKSSDGLLEITMELKDFILDLSKE